MKLLLIALLILSSCATTAPGKSQISIYVDTNKPLAESGQIKWSDYYLGLYDAASKETHPITGDALSVYNHLINKAKEYESNAITKDEFYSFRRDANARLAKLWSDYQMRMYEIEASREKEPFVFITPERAPLRLPPQQRQTNCTSYRIGDTIQTNCQ